MPSKPKTGKPNAGRFKAGVSGNPNGRPRKAASNMGSALEKVLNEPVTIVEKGRRRRITKKDAIAMQLVTKAAQGEPRATQHVLNAMRHYDTSAEKPVAAASWSFSEDDEKVIAQVVERILLSAPKKAA